MLKSELKKLIPDKLYLKIMYKRIMGKKLNLKNPQTFNEKLQWLKLYDRKPIYTTMVDKYEVKQFVANIIGEEYIIPTLGVWNSFDDIDFDSLPDRFVLKTTHDSGGVVICSDKRKLDLDTARKKLTKSLKNNFYYQGREWPYKNVKPRIIAEKYVIDDITGELRDYKFFCFDGDPKFMFIATERQDSRTETKFDFFDMTFTHMDFRNGHPNAEVIPEKPVSFEKMAELAGKLSAGIPQIRVDFYQANGRIFFGELTFFFLIGLVPFEPDEWDKKLGDLITLPQ